ncbi:UbiA family prenyltransferase [Sorangium sp. So ce1099]|uniref:UbiA family prenyltransferase n=1 Tax=Sorangium sp. So ce1099 TaxID=3133331 RepID=UPI003F5D879B
MTSRQPLALSTLSAPAPPRLAVSASRQPPSLLRLPALLGAEVSLWYRFVRRDLPAVVIPGLVMAAAALRSTGATAILDWARVIGSGLVFFGLYLYAFCLINQISGAEEDALNKPDRPIPSGLVTLQGARLRWAIVMAAYPITGLCLGGIRLACFALLAQLLFVAHEQGGLHRHWLTKNLCCAAGLLALLAGAWQMAAPLTPAAWRWIAFAVTTFGLTLPLQDLRDAEGDRRSGRTSLSMSVGEPAARAILAGLIALLPAATHFLLIAPLHRGLRGAACEALLALLNLATAARTATLRGERADHATYMLHTFWFSALVASALVVL